MPDWTNEVTIQFLEAYQGEPILWDPKDKFHKDKKKVNDGWLRLSEKFEIPVATLKKKKDSLMATFRGHLRKKKASIKSGAGLDEMYKPIWFAYETMEAFLGAVYECNPTINTENLENQHTELEEQGQDSVDSEHTTDELSGIVHEVRQPAICQFSLTPKRVRQQSSRRREQIPPELQEAGEQMKEAFTTFNNVLKRKQTEEDDCDLYGKLVAKKLRKLPEEERQLLMYEMDGIFIRRYRASKCNRFEEIHYNNSSNGFQPSASPSSEINIPSLPSTSHSTHSALNSLPFSSPLSETNIPRSPSTSHSTHSALNSQPFPSPSSETNIPSRPSTSHSTYTVLSHSQPLYPSSGQCYQQNIIEDAYFNAIEHND